MNWEMIGSVEKFFMYFVSSSSLLNTIMGHFKNTLLNLNSYSNDFYKTRSLYINGTQKYYDLNIYLLAKWI